jgi:hypothetical protein
MRLAGGDADLVSVEPEVMDGRRSRRAAMLEEVFRGLAVVGFICGAGVTGGLVLVCFALTSIGLGAWPYVAAVFIVVGGLFWTLFLWSFLLLCSSIAGYLGDRTQHTRMEMME